MCGFSGFLQPAEWTPDELKIVVHKMTNRLSHRGPDGHGVWVDEHHGFALGHRRLSIQDYLCFISQCLELRTLRDRLQWRGLQYINFAP